jgi:putative ABC transport system ATP-binding protein/macrolide transport system ATP-binding/permease protein/lipoprotein-releasing system ATP-binding protein
VLEVCNLSKTYLSGPRPIAAVADVSLDVRASEFLAVCGRSGSGKSTLLGMLGGICRPTGGTVRFNGIDIWSLPSNGRAAYRNHQVGLVFQFDSLLATLRAIDNVALPALLAGRAGPETAYHRAEKLLARVGLGDRLGAYSGELSGGQQRRVALARALVNEPPLLLADEPTADLDEQSEREVFRLLLDLHREGGTTLLLVTHNTTLAREADRVIHLCSGRIVSATVPERPLLLPHSPGVSGVGTSETVAERVVAREPDVKPGPDGKTVDAEAGRALGGLGAAFGRFLMGVATWAAVVVLAALIANYGTALYQQSRVAEKRAANQQLQEVALYRMRADIDDLVAEPDRGYLLTLYAQNLEPENDLFVMTPEVRAFVQVGLQWQEVPLRSADNQQGQVVCVTAEKHRFRFRFTPDLKAFEEILPGYMHVRFSNVMLVSRSAEPEGDLIERADDYYVYLKPHDADDVAILRKTRFPGKPPLWIPMPPH